MPSGHIAGYFGGCTTDGGALVIVQVWAWSRIHVLRPQLMKDVQADPRAPLGAIWDQLDFMLFDQLRENDHTYWATQHASHVEVWHQWQLPVRDGPVFAVEEVDDMASVVVQEPLSSPSQMAIFAKKVQTIIRRCMLFIGKRGEGSGEVERGEGSRGGHLPVDPFDSPNLDIPSFSLGLTPLSQSLPGGSGTLCTPPPPGLGFAPFQSLAGTSLGFSSFRAPPPPSTAGLSALHQPISQASSSDEEERTDDTDDVQHLGFRHRVGKKTTRFAPSDWP
ncbi:hypothetical protein M9H77_05049 [Catharanthus roseus]|uniref:Uncharacterized protein n=1 Tax=Catharanthus roseus TaxID=4058 RepID=A0ACC0CFY8_CATRO|nr:hypothetical protein M9H77_05049 [Catharanthus roseus]